MVLNTDFVTEYSSLPGSKVNQITAYSKAFLCLFLVKLIFLHFKLLPMAFMQLVGMLVRHLLTMNRKAGIWNNNRRSTMGSCTFSILWKHENFSIDSWVAGSAHWKIPKELIWFTCAKMYDRSISNIFSYCLKIKRTIYIIRNYFFVRLCIILNKTVAFSSKSLWLKGAGSKSWNTCSAIKDRLHL